MIKEYVMRNFLFTLILAFGLSAFVCGAEEPNWIECEIKHTDLIVGDPVVIKVSYTYQTPQIHESGRPFSSIKHNAILEVRVPDSNDIRYYPVLPQILPRQDSDGLVYSGIFVFIYDYLLDSIIFSKEGKYEIRFIKDTKEKYLCPANIITIKKGSDEQNQVLSILKKDEYHYLEGGSYKNDKAEEESKERIEKAIQLSSETNVTKWLSVQVGIDAYRELQKKYKNKEDFMQLFRVPTPPKEPIEKIKKQIEQGLALPDEYPIRQKALIKLIEISDFEKNAEMKQIYMKELHRKYEGK